MNKKSLVVYGIPNCDSVKKAIQWLEKSKLAFRFHDYKKVTISEELLVNWFQQVGIETIVNKKSTTYRCLSEDELTKLGSPKSAIAIIQNHTSLIKRPIIEKDGKILLVGFNANDYLTSLGIS